MLFCLLFILEGMTVRAEESFYEGRLLFTPYGCSSNGIRPPKVTFGEGPDARQPLLLWPDTVQCGARCRVNSNPYSSSDRSLSPAVLVTGREKIIPPAGLLGPACAITAFMMSFF